MIKQILAGQLRHFLTTGAGMLVAGGYISQSDTATVIGFGMLVAGIGWSALEKYLRQKAPQVAQIIDGEGK